MSLLQGIEQKIKLISEKHLLCKNYCFALKRPVGQLKAIISGQYSPEELDPNSRSLSILLENIRVNTAAIKNIIDESIYYMSCVVNKYKQALQILDENFKSDYIPEYENLYDQYNQYLNAEEYLKGLQKTFIKEMNKLIVEFSSIYNQSHFQSVFFEMTLNPVQDRLMNLELYQRGC